MTEQTALHAGRKISHHYRGICMVLAGMLLVLASATRAGAAGAPGGGPSWQMGLRSTAYMFQTEDTDGATEDRFQTYNLISGAATGLLDGHLVFRGAGRFANNPAVDYPGFETSRLYNGYLEARVSPLVKARVGRQFIQSGVTSLSLDGAWLQYRRGRGLDLAVYGGARAPLSHGFEAGDPDQDAAVGGLVAFRPHRRWRLAFSAAYRERYGLVAARPVGLELNTSAVRNTRLFGRATYDFEGERLSRLQAQGRWRGTRRGPVVTVQYLDRHPSVDSASWFSRFTDVKRIRLLRGAVRWEAPSRFGGEVEYTGSFVDTRNSSRVGLAVLVPGGRAGYSIRVGDAGEENRIYGELSGRVLPWLWLDGEATFLTYALLQDAPAADERDLTTLSARARAQLRPGLRLMAEVQSLDNPFFSEDVRVLVGVDVSMARGDSRFGLDRGGWLR